jgi:hypothetical protein
MCTVAQGSNRKMEKRIDKEIKWARGVSEATGGVPTTTRALCVLTCRDPWRCR